MTTTYRARRVLTPVAALEPGYGTIDDDQITDVTRHPATQPHRGSPPPSTTAAASNPANDMIAVSHRLGRPVITQTWIAGQTAFGNWTEP